MGDWNRLLAELDKTVGFPNKIRSSIKKRWQGFDQWRNEHVIWLEYRVKVHPGSQPPPKPPRYLRDVHKKPVSAPAKSATSMGTIRELMDVRFVNTVDSSPSIPSNGPGKKTTKRTSIVPRRRRPKPSLSPYRTRLETAPTDDSSGPVLCPPQCECAVPAGQEGRPNLEHSKLPAGPGVGLRLVMRIKLH